MKTTSHIKSPVSFFLEKAGWSYDPKTQSPMEGKLKCAQALAEAEQEASARGLSFQWEIDSTADSSDFDKDSAYSLWMCVCRSQGGELLSSLGGVDFGKDGDPWGQPYRRVVEAELAQEAISQ